MPRPRPYPALAAALQAFLIAAAARTEQVPLRLQDDRGLSIESGVTVCYHQGLETRCLENGPYVIPVAVQDFDSLSVEGPEYGPTSIERPNLKADKSGRYTVAVPRKAILSITGLPDDAVTLSLYGLSDDTFRKPAFRWEHIGTQELRIPAQSFLASLSHGLDAPDLVVIEAEPGRRQSVAYHRRDGWSAVVRVLSSDKNASVSGAIATLLSASGPDSEHEFARAVSGRGGLALFTGVVVPFVTLSASAEGFLKARTPGVMAGRGSFTSREVRLERGGNVRASITIDGRPASGALCRLVSTRAKRKEGERWPKGDVFFETKIGKDGICTTARVLRGEYVFQLIPEDAKNSNDQAVSVLENQTTEVEVRLRRLAVRGTVTRRGAPEPGAIVLILNDEDTTTSPSGRNTPPEPLKLETDEEGHYHGFVWRPGKYDFGIVNKAYMNAASKEALVEDEETVVDFDLNQDDIS